MPDQHYGLPIVVCPSCSRASVRTRHPDIEFWRGIRRTRNAVGMVFLKTVFMLYSGIIFGLIAVESDDVFSPMGRLEVMAPLLNPDPFEAMEAAGVLILSMILVFIACSLIMHRRVLVPVSILLGIALVTIVADYGIGIVGRLLADMLGVSSRHSIPDTREMIGRFERFGLYAGVGMLGLLPAQIFKRLIQRSTTRRFRKLLKKRRKQREIYD